MSNRNNFVPTALQVWAVRHGYHSRCDGNGRYVIDGFFATIWADDDKALIVSYCDVNNQQRRNYVRAAFESLGMMLIGEDEQAFSYAFNPHDERQAKCVALATVAVPHRAIVAFKKPYDPTYQPVTRTAEQREQR